MIYCPLAEKIFNILISFAWPPTANYHFFPFYQESGCNASKDNLYIQEVLDSLLYESLILAIGWIGLIFCKPYIADRYLN